MPDSLLYNAIREVKGLLCLQCPVEGGCDETDPMCPYRIAKSRKQYQRDYYLKNRERKIAAATARNRALGSVYLDYQKDYKREYRRQGREN